MATRGSPVPGVPFDERAGIIPNAQGRIIDPDKTQTVTGEYAVGWIKRGPSGIIGTNKPDAQETVDQMLADLALARRSARQPRRRSRSTALLEGAHIEYVTFADWLKLDAIEQQRGAALNRPRVKFTTIAGDA